MERKIYLLGTDNKNLSRRQFICNFHFETKQEIENKNIKEVYTTNLEFLNFDLLNDFKEIYLFYYGFYYRLKLGKNSWTKKELRKKHNLLKLVECIILR